MNRKINGKGREYDYHGKVEFKKEFLNGYRNGIGKEFYEGQLIFEGEYLNGERKGKGKEYYTNANLKYKDGNGQIEEYNYDGEFIFEGEYINGKRCNGKV